MKAKFAIFIASVFCIAGLASGVIGLSVLGWDFIKLDTMKYTETVLSVEQTDLPNVKNITVDLKDSRLVIVRKDQETITFSCLESEKDTFEAAVTGDTLAVIEHYERKKINWGLSFFKGMRKALTDTVLTIPTGMKITSINATTENARLSVDGVSAETGVFKTTNSSVNVENATYNKLTVATINGHADVDHVTADELTVSTKNGSIDVDNVTGRTVSVTSQNGRVEVSNLMYNGEEIGSLNAQTSNGRLILDSIQTNHVMGKNSNGSIEAKDFLSKKTTLSTTNGHLEIVNVAADALQLTNENGKITGSINGVKEHFTIDAKTTNASCNLDNTDGSTGLTLYVRTSNAKIDLNFLH